MILLNEQQFNSRSGLVRIEIERIEGRVRAMELAKPDPPAESRLRVARQKLGKARCDLDDDRFAYIQRITGALGDILTAKKLIAEAIAMQEERDLRRSWGEIR